MPIPLVDVCGVLSLEDADALADMDFLGGDRARILDKIPPVREISDFVSRHVRFGSMAPGSAAYLFGAQVSYSAFSYRPDVRKGGDRKYFFRPLPSPDVYSIFCSMKLSGDQFVSEGGYPTTCQHGWDSKSCFERLDWLDPEVFFELSWARSLQMVWFPQLGHQLRGSSTNVPIVNAIQRIVQAVPPGNVAILCLEVVEESYNEYTHLFIRATDLAFLFVSGGHRESLVRDVLSDLSLSYDGESVESSSYVCDAQGRFVMV
jgi:hypothetical protein